MEAGASCGGRIVEGEPMLLCSQHPGEEPGRGCVDWKGRVIESVTNEKPLRPQNQKSMLLPGVHTISLPHTFHGSDIGKEEPALEKILLLDSWSSSVIHDDGSGRVLRLAI